MRTLVSRTLSVCTTMAGRRLPSRIHQISPRRGSTSPFIVTIALSHLSALILAPSRLVLGYVPTVLLKVPTSLLANLLRFQQICQKSGTRGAAPLRLSVGECDEIVWDGNTNFHCHSVSHRGHTSVIRNCVASIHGGGTRSGSYLLWPFCLPRSHLNAISTLRRLASLPSSKARVWFPCCPIRPRPDPSSFHACHVWSASSAPPGSPAPPPSQPSRDLESTP